MALAAAGSGLALKLLVIAPRCHTKSVVHPHSMEILRTSESFRQTRGVRRTQCECMELVGNQAANRKVRRLGGNSQKSAKSVQIVEIDANVSFLFRDLRNRGKNESG